MKKTKLGWRVTSILEMWWMDAGEQLENLWCHSWLPRKRFPSAVMAMQCAKRRTRGVHNVYLQGKKAGIPEGQERRLFVCTVSRIDGAQSFTSEVVLTNTKYGLTIDKKASLRPDIFSPSCQVHELTALAHAGEIEILDHPKVVTSIDYEGRTPLHILAETGSKHVLEHPMVATLQNLRGQTPLHILAEAGLSFVSKHRKVAELFDNAGNTPLHLLAGTGDRSVLRHPCVATVRNHHGATPLHDLAREGVKLVLRHPKVADVADIHGVTPLHLLAQASVFEILRHPKVGAVVDKWNQSPLHYFARFASSRIKEDPHFCSIVLLNMKKVKESDTLKDKDGWTPLGIVDSYLPLARHGSIEEDPTSISGTRTA